MGKVDRLKRNNMIKDICNVGLGMMDVISMFNALNASWMIRILKGNPVDENWLQIPLAEFDKLGGISIVKYFNFEKDCGMVQLEQLSVFYRDFVSSYSKAIFFDIEVFKSTILNQPLWGNKFITVKKKGTGKSNVLLLHNWLSSDIVFVKDLMFVNGVIDAAFVIL
jgi:hypothetical protein